jgi:hypothetical protein
VTGADELRQAYRPRAQPALDKQHDRHDSYSNVLENPHAGLLFPVPGVGETLRVNGGCTPEPAERTSGAAILGDHMQMTREAAETMLEESYTHRL